MEVITFDVMCEGRFLTQFRIKWCPLFKLNTEEVYNAFVKDKPYLRTKKIELYKTDNVVM